MARLNAFLNVHKQILIFLEININKNKIDKNILKILTNFFVKKFSCAHTRTKFFKSFEQHS